MGQNDTFDSGDRLQSAGDKAQRMTRRGRLKGKLARMIRALEKIDSEAGASFAASVAPQQTIAKLQRIAQDALKDEKGDHARSPDKCSICGHVLSPHEDGTHAVCLGCYDMPVLPMEES